MDSNDVSSVLTVLGNIVNGGPHAIILILMLIITALLWYIKRLQTEVDRKDTKIEKIVNDYYEGNLTLAGALDSLKTVLYEIKARM